MYYPILRARQFELIALRDLANEEKLQNHIRPIIEPVKKSDNNLKLAHKVFEEKSINAYLIVNPIVGEVKGNTDQNFKFINDYTMFQPAFYYRNNADYIERSIEDNNFQNCLLICPNDISLDDENFTSLAISTNIKAICVEDPGRNRDLKKFVKDLGKIHIRLDDLFEKQNRNSDFLEIDEHMFSEEHLYYTDEGYSGFADYTVLPSEYQEGGSTPRAVVIHLTFLNKKNKIWIKHFTSNTNDSIANIQGKFAEAANKAVMYCRAKELTNSAIEELETLYDEHHYPGLGTVKKISIKNHLLVVEQFLSENL